MQLFKANISKSVKSQLLTDRYIEPPFSILNTITQRWQNRKREWLNIIGDSTEGRDVKRFNATPTNTFSARGDDVKAPKSVSEFDPVLAELMVTWFSNKGDYILDPFAGGVVRGAVASMLDRYYVGIDLSEEQIQANRRIRARLIDEGHLDMHIPEWICGDADMATKPANGEIYNMADMIFTCPPYYNLERYSNDPDDLSNQKTYDDFILKYGRILEQSAECLQEGFFVIVVSEIRHQRSGEMYGFVADTINILQGAGLYYYNEIILENNIGSLPIRAPKYFDDSRKIGRQHQNILVFYKGDLENIKTKYKAFE